MLGKIMKYEWRSTWKVNVLLLGIYLGSIILMEISGFLPVWEANNDVTALLLLTILLLFYGALLCCSIGVPLFLTIRYYKSMYSNEGYLTHTLPISSNQLFLGKLFHFCIWKMIVDATILIGVVMCVLTVIRISSGEPITILDIWKEVLRAIIDMPGDASMDEAWSFLALTGLTAVVSVFSVPLKCMGAVDIGQLWKRHKVAGAILIYLGIYVFQQIVSFVLMVGVSLAAAETGLSVFRVYNKSVGFVLATEIIVSVVMVVSSELIIKRKVNLD